MRRFFLAYVLTMILFSMFACNKVEDNKPAPQAVKTVEVSCGDGVKRMAFLQSKGFQVVIVPEESYKYILKDSLNHKILYVKLYSDDCSDYSPIEIYSY